MNTLLSPYTLNSTLTLKNRLVMAPMTRNLASNELVPTDDMAAYYARRAQAGLIVTEGTIIRPDSRGYSNVPGIYTPKHIAGWQQVTKAVHDNGGVIFLQIWHVGRVAHPHFLEGALPIGPSDSVMTGKVNRAPEFEYGASRAVTTDEIAGLIDSFALAATNAMTAGFDGVEIHGANGYLIDQFLHVDTNRRQDNFGGSAENNARFAIAVVDACGAAIGYDRVGLRLSPGAYLNQINGDPRDADTFSYLLSQLNTRNLAYVHTGNFNDSTTFPELNDKTMTQFIREHYQGNVIACGSYSITTANAAIENKQADLIALGRPFLANADLIEKIRHSQPLRDYDVSMLATLD